MDSGPKASLCHGEHIRVHRMSCRLLEGFTFVHRIDRKRNEMIPDRVLAIKKFQRPPRELLRVCNAGPKEMLRTAMRWRCRLSGSPVPSAENAYDRESPARHNSHGWRPQHGEAFAGNGRRRLERRLDALRTRCLRARQ
jgi:hypothetical protein